MLQRLCLGRPGRRQQRVTADLPVVLEVRTEILDWLALALPVAVDESVGQDPVQPGAQVGARPELVEGPVGLGQRLLDEILGALRDLPEDFRVAIYLADIEGYPYREIAEMMGTPIGTVMSRLHRGRARLREKLAKYAPRQELPALYG